MQRLRTPSALQEAVRGLYARLALAGFGSGERRTLLVTSSEGREGKTFLALALAQFAAASGRRVLLVECDMRRPDLRTALDGLRAGASSPGLADYLAGKVQDVPVIRASGSTGFEVVLAGAASLASTELLAGPRLDGLLKLARGYDLVLLDSPPCEALMDALVIAPRVDGVLYCAHWGRAEPERVASGLQGLHDAGGKVAGLVVTFSPRNNRLPYGASAAGQQHLRLTLESGA